MDRDVRGFLCNILTIVAVLSSIAGTALAGPPRPLDPAFVEVVREEIKVSNPFFVGTMLGDSVQPAQRREIHLWLPATAATRLCLYVRSIDGVYTASRRYDLGATGAGHYVLSFAARERRLVASYDSLELILDARLGNDCSEVRVLSSLPTAWGGFVSPDSLLVFINSDRNQAKVIVPQRSGEEPPAVFECRPIPAGRQQRRFDSYCVLRPLPELNVEGAELQFFRFGENEGLPSPLGLIPPYVN